MAGVLTVSILYGAAGTPVGGANPRNVTVLQLETYKRPGAPCNFWSTAFR